MSEKKERKLITERSDLIVDLPRRHVILKLKGSVTSYGLYHIAPKTKGEYMDELEFVGYYGSLVASTKGFLKSVPDKDLTGRIKIEDISKYYEEIKEELNLLDKK